MAKYDREIFLSFLHPPEYKAGLILQRERHKGKHSYEIDIVYLTNVGSQIQLSNPQDRQRLATITHQSKIYIAAHGIKLMKPEDSEYLYAHESGKGGCFAITALADFLKKQCPNLSQAAVKNKVKLSLLSCYGGKGVKENLTQTQAYALYSCLQYVHNISCLVVARTDIVELAEYSKSLFNKKHQPIGHKICLTQYNGQDCYYYEYGEETLYGYIHSTLKETLFHLAISTNHLEKTHYLLDLLKKIKEINLPHTEISSSTFFTVEGDSVAWHGHDDLGKKINLIACSPANIATARAAVIELLTGARDHAIINAHSNKFSSMIGKKTNSFTVISNCIDFINTNYPI